MAYRLTIRHGASVERQRFDDLDGALAAAQRGVARIKAEGPLPEVSMMRTFAPADRVAARVELSSGGLLRGRSAGVDVMGDGTLIAFGGGVRRERLAPADGQSAFDVIRRELEG